MEWLRARLFGANIEEGTHACITCSNPCTVHPAVPEYLKIDYESPLANTVKPFVRHVLVCKPTPSKEWRPKLEEVQGSLEQRLAAVATAAGEHLGGRVVITALDVSSTPSPLATLHSVHSAPGDVEFIVLPEGTAILVPATHDAAAVLQGYLTAPDDPLPDAVQRHAVFVDDDDNTATTLLLVCAHKLRDKRCGVVGPMLLDAFRAALQARPIHGRRVLVYGVSHTGGHKFAGNVLVYPPGNWYGRVTPCHVDELLSVDVQGGGRLEALYRGGLPP